MHSWKIGGLALGMVAVELASAQLSQQQGMCRRWGHQSAVINNTLYLMGGFRLRKDFDGDKLLLDPSSEFISLALGTDASFDVVKNTTLATPPPWVAINYTVNGAAALPHVANGGMFVDGQDIFIYEGRVPHSNDQIGSSLWEWDHTTSVWAEAQTWVHTDPRSPNRYSRGGALTIPGRGYGVYVGGARIFINDSAVPLNGEAFYPEDEQVVTFDLTPGSGANGNRKRNATALPDDEKRIGSSLAYLPVGPQGLVVLLGGTEEGTNVRTTTIEANVSASAAGFTSTSLALSSMRRIQILDLATGEWHSQSATGEYVPDTRMHSCLAVQSAPDNSSHNIYMFGGGSGSDMFVIDDDVAYNDLWILSLPSFRWTRKVYTTTDQVPAGRQQHECHVVGRNMVVIGGTANQTAGKGNCSWDEISVMDMTTLEWLTKYDYNTNPYTIPDQVSAAIVSNGQTLMDPNNGWDDPQLEALFKGKPTGTVTESRVVRYGVIGGAVAGGVIFTTLIAVGICLCRRRQRRRTERLQRQQHQQHQHQQAPPNFVQGAPAPFQYPGVIPYGNTGIYAQEADNRALLNASPAPGFGPEKQQYAYPQPSPLSAVSGGSSSNYGDVSQDPSREPLIQNNSFAAELPDAPLRPPLPHHDSQYRNSTASFELGA